MAVRIKKTKVYVSNVEIKKVEKKGEKPQYFVVADGSFMSARQNEKGEWIKDDPFFTNIISFDNGVNSLLKEIKNSEKKAGFLVVDGKLSTKINEKDGKKYSSNSFVLYAAEKVVYETKKETEAVEADKAEAVTVSDEEVPF